VALHHTPGSKGFLRGWFAGQNLAAIHVCGNAGVEERKSGVGSVEAGRLRGVAPPPPRRPGPGTRPMMGAWRTTNPSSESSDRGTGVGAVGGPMGGGRGGGCGALDGHNYGADGVSEKNGGDMSAHVQENARGGRTCSPTHTPLQKRHCIAHPPTALLR